MGARPPLTPWADACVARMAEHRHDATGEPDRRHRPTRPVDPWAHGRDDPHRHGRGRDRRRLHRDRAPGRSSQGGRRRGAHGRGTDSRALTGAAVGETHKRLGMDPATHHGIFFGSVAGNVRLFAPFESTTTVIPGPGRLNTVSLVIPNVIDAPETTPCGPTRCGGSSPRAAKRTSPLRVAESSDRPLVGDIKALG